ncbi:hypothetical protein [Streptomyces anthocyanicus]|uniref:hypothetical protein n=1 Tax=Streptomyces anthocyanicus TaxID=68174 RepID=UPI00362E3F1C
MAEVLVTVQEIATATGRKADKVREECTALGVTVRDDWAGRPAVTVDDARGLASGSTRRSREHVDEQARVKAACKQWVEDRTAAAMAGADAAEEKVKRGRGRSFLPGAFVRQGEVSPAEIHAARREGYQHAGAQFERRNRRPGPYVGLIFVDSAEEGSALASAVGALRGPAKAQAPVREVA